MASEKTNREAAENLPEIKAQEARERAGERKANWAAGQAFPEGGTELSSGKIGTLSVAALAAAAYAGGMGTVLNAALFVPSVFSKFAAALTIERKTKSAFAAQVGRAAQNAGLAAAGEAAQLGALAGKIAAPLADYVNPGSKDALRWFSALCESKAYGLEKSISARLAEDPETMTEAGAWRAACAMLERGKPFEAARVWAASPFNPCWLAPYAMAGEAAADKLPFVLALGEAFETALADVPDGEEKKRARELAALCMELVREATPDEELLAAPAAGELKLSASQNALGAGPFDLVFERSQAKAAKQIAAVVAGEAAALPEGASPSMAMLANGLALAAGKLGKMFPQERCVVQLMELDEGAGWAAKWERKALSGGLRRAAQLGTGFQGDKPLGRMELFLLSRLNRLGVKGPAYVPSRAGAERMIIVGSRQKDLEKFEGGTGQGIFSFMPELGDPKSAGRAFTILHEFFHKKQDVELMRAKEDCESVLMPSAFSKAKIARQFAGKQAHLKIDKKSGWQFGMLKEGFADIMAACALSGDSEIYAAKLCREVARVRREHSFYVEDPKNLKEKIFAAATQSSDSHQTYYALEKMADLLEQGKARLGDPEGLQEAAKSCSLYGLLTRAAELVEEPKASPKVQKQALFTLPMFSFKSLKKVDRQKAPGQLKELAGLALQSLVDERSRASVNGPALK